jgi:hypothetical protein
MRSLNKNKRQLHYALYLGDNAIRDEYGDETGEYIPVYGDITPFMGNLSSATGEDAVQAFGSFTSYSRVLCVADSECPISERSVLWFGISTEKPYNYIVIRKADSKNGIMYALQEVTVGS